ncbi:CheY-like chemotaxis protein [Pseudomonas citronellolis]|uniref:hypothetical protein n=1 Tax=Pseudomonas citronellolis TaxID=53408 RepID=UPI00209E8610|nr:hypothetical protein [Pseudomonas citronellolis]MCP1642032.1 CheY-like chemotaxis protein [Pseudomonas citronellolis]MCP1664950.1 CheY-like chemotaxis protein [Pseudomonas citronellolis]MCP1695591.1 CheY-like chemotaxis protein [Pseudomonas citronellolis]MCP1702786.1 CheY-like chemotaxis protein [Pseudomonas citronellolis]MCP1796746.1 CheY-like chemotaxis protein [Pseudomonas citronellolis]
MEWNVLVVDDREELARQTVDIISSSRTLKDNSFACDISLDFEEAKRKVVKSKYDLVILDLRDDKSDNDTKGKEVLESLREAQFFPVIFYTGYAEKVNDLKTPLVQVVAKGDDDTDSLRGAVQSIFGTGLPQLVRYIHEQQKNYLWSHVDEFWKKTAPLCAPAELAYLLARRLGNALRGSSIREFLEPTRGSVDVIHPVEMYVWPPMGDKIQTGDLLKVEDSYFVVLNPACDFAQSKVEFVMLAECVPLKDCKEHIDLIATKGDGKTADGNQIGALKSLISDNRGGKKVQPERYKFLPGTVFLEDLVIDFQRIRTLGFDDAGLAAVDRVATLDAPFVESLLSKFSRYYGRIGTPNLDSGNLAKEVVDGIWGGGS